ncbi:MAG: VWA domain-containing protein [Clostridiales bacterium]|nr:VWA domain-containing protein [Clostridiales bacterium]
MYCTNCGTECKPGINFCPQCGQKLITETSESQQDSKTEYTGQEPAKAREGFAKIILACLITLLAACAGFAGIYYFVLREPDVKDTGAQVSSRLPVKVPDNSQNSQNSQNETEAPTPAPETKVPEIPRQRANIDITAIDTVDFPKVTVYFSVKDLDGQLIDTIDASQLSVFEKNNGSEQDWRKAASSVQYYGRKDVKEKSVAFVMDISGSMEGSLETECDAADALINQMQQDGNYQVALTAFSNTQHEWLDYTSDFSDFSSYLYDLQASGGTAFYDTLNNTLNHALYETGQKYILAFTDGEDNQSVTEYSEILAMAESYKIPIYIITTLDDETVYVEDMQQIADVSGGSLYTIYSMDDLQNIYYEIFQLQQEQCSLTFETAQNTYSDIKLQFLSDKYEGEAEDSYYAEKPRQYYARPEIDYVTASSERKGMYDSKKLWCTYIADNVWDGDNRTSWTEGVKGDGIGEYLTVWLKKETEVNGLLISNGYYKNKELYYRNNRIKKVRFTFSDGSSMVTTLDDEYLSPCDVQFEEPVLTSSIKIEVLSVYKCKKVNGKKAYRDTCITELELY